MTEMLRNEGLKRVRMRLITAVVFVFTLTCSGSFGMEDVISSSGPGLTLLMILILPLVWSVPMAFVASKLGSMVPAAGGLYRWIRRGMGEYWSFQAGWWWTLSLYAAVAGIIAGGSAIAGGLYAHSAQPMFGYPQFFGMKWDQGFSGVGMLVGIGIIMLVGGLLSLKWPSVGTVIVCLGAIVGLIYTYDRGMYHWVPLVYYWWAPWLFSWIAGIFAGLSMSQRVQQLGAQEDGAVERA